MALDLISKNDSTYPPMLNRCLGDSAPTNLALIGNQALLTCRPLGIFCSVQCPGDLILKTYDLACALRDTRVPVISGFHSPMEKECLQLLLRGTQPIIVCLARGIERMRTPPEWKKPLAEDQLLILSGFPPANRRVTAELALARNRIAASLADKVFIAYASPDSKTEQFCREVIGWGKLLFTVDCKENQALLNLGAIPISSNAALVPSIMDSVLN